MGNPFSTKKKVEVGTSVQRMVDDPQLPDTAKVSVISTILGGERDASIAENLIQDFRGSLGLRARRLYDWAKTHYTYGMPTCYLGSIMQGESTVEARIETLLGHAITTVYFHYSPLNHVHWGWIKLIADYGYNTETNELETTSAFIGTPVYLKSMVAVYTQATYDAQDYASLEQWYNPEVPGQTFETDASGAILKLAGYAATTSFIVDEAATEDTLELVVVYQNYLTAEGAPSTTLVTHEVPIVIPITGINEDVRYYHVKYRWMDGRTERIGYWLYEDEAGIYPEIDAIHQDEYTQLGAFYPWIHFRDDKVNLNGPGKAGTPDHVSSTKACDYLGLDYASLTDSIHENPDIGDVEQAMLIMGVAANTPHQAGLRYLFQFFNQLVGVTVDLVNIPDSQLDEKLKTNLREGEKAIILKDREFAMALRYKRIEKRLRAGKIAEVGKYALVTGTMDEQATIKKRDGLGAVFSMLETISAGNSYFYQKQVTSATYEEVRVYGLALQYFIYKPGTTSEKSFTAGFGADELIIPLDHNIAKTFSLSKREDLYAMSMHMVFNSKIVIKTKWYQQGWFKVVLIVAAIVWMAYTGDFTQLTTLLAEQGMQALVMAVLKQIVIGYAIQLGLNYLAQFVGAELALILAAVATAYAIYRGSVAGSLKGAPWAEEMLQLATGLSKASMTETQRQMGKLADKYEKLEDQIEVADKELKRVEDLLRVDTVLDPMEFVAQEPFFVSGERPYDYFTRTVESGNTGIRALDAISAYAANALRLPTLSETEGEFYAAR